MIQDFETNSPEETFRIGFDFGRMLSPNSIVCFYGDLAAGKTTFIKGLVQSLNLNDVIEVNSPTFVYLQTYPTIPPVFHFDLYRLKDEREFLEMGFDEFLYCGGISCIEWSERIDSLIPNNVWKVTFIHCQENCRKIEIQPPIG